VGNTDDVRDGLHLAPVPERDAREQRPQVDDE
jgi:hypothetical protein